MFKSPPLSTNNENPSPTLLLRLESKISPSPPPTTKLRVGYPIWLFSICPYFNCVANFEFLYMHIYIVVMKCKGVEKECIKILKLKQGYCDPVTCATACAYTFLHGIGTCWPWGAGPIVCRCSYPCHHAPPTTSLH